MPWLALLVMPALVGGALTALFLGPLATANPPISGWLLLGCAALVVLTPVLAVAAHLRLRPLATVGWAAGALVMTLFLALLMLTAVLSIGVATELGHGGGGRFLD